MSIEQEENVEATSTMPGKHVCTIEVSSPYVF